MENQERQENQENQERQETQLLCTFTNRNKLNDIIEEIQNNYKVLYNRIYILENLNNERELICTYNIILNDDRTLNKPLKNTISIHRKKQTNTLYTINALNEVVCLLNDGKPDPSFPVPWENYRNTLMITHENGLKMIKTKVFDIVRL